jgi:hypothetical protein
MAIGHRRRDERERGSQRSEGKSRNAAACLGPVPGSTAASAVLIGALADEPSSQHQPAGRGARRGDRDTQGLRLVEPTARRGACGPRDRQIHQLGRPGYSPTTPANARVQGLGAVSPSLRCEIRVICQGPSSLRSGCGSNASFRLSYLLFKNSKPASRAGTTRESEPACLRASLGRASRWLGGKARGR